MANPRLKIPPRHTMFNIKLPCPKIDLRDVTGTARACQCGLFAKMARGPARRRHRNHRNNFNDRRSRAPPAREQTC